VRDLRAELLAAEAAHFAKTRGTAAPAAAIAAPSAKRQVEDGRAGDEEDVEAKRRRILEETREIDADSEGSGESESSEEESDDEDETAELQRELEKIKRERAEKREREEREREEAEEEERSRDVAGGNPLLNPRTEFGVKRRWDDDVIFRNQARGTEEKRKKEFVNVGLVGSLLAGGTANVGVGFTALGLS
jgi:protein CWC15